MFHQALSLPSSTLTPPQFQSPKPNSVRCAASVRGRPQTTISAPASLYEVLKVSRDASFTEIKLAYRNLAKLYHPDASDRSDGQDFIQIHKAYETLSDPASRSVYDLSLGLGGRPGRLTSASFGSDSGPGRRRSAPYQTSRRWETDQCW